MVVNCLLFSKNVSLVNLKNNIKSYIDITILNTSIYYIKRARHYFMKKPSECFLVNLGT